MEGNYTLKLNLRRANIVKSALEDRRVDLARKVRGFESGGYALNEGDVRGELREINTMLEEL